MNAKQKKYLIAGVAVAAAAGAYFFFFADPSSPWTFPANVAKANTIAAWYLSTPNASQWKTFFTTKATQADIDNMYALITMYWDQNVQPPTDITNYFTQTSNYVDTL